MLYLGEINDQQQASWRKSLSVFDEDTQRFTTMSLFPDDRPVPANAVDSLQVRLSGLELRRPPGSEFRLHREWFVSSAMDGCWARTSW